MTVLLADLVVPASETDVLQLELTLAQQLGLSTTAWQPLGMARTILAINANLAAQYSQTVALVAQGGYASYAALMVDANNNPITTWMDLVGTNQYNVTRIPASQAAGFNVVGNTSGQSYSWSPNSPLHFQNPATGATYTTVGSGTISSSGLTSVSIQADLAYIGSVGTSGAGVTLAILTPLAGVSSSTLAMSLVGTDAESNGHYFARCQSKLGSLSPNGAQGAYLYVVESLPVFNTTLPSGLLYTAPTSQNPYGVTSEVTRATATLNIGSGVVNVYVANASGAPFGSAQNTITGITNIISAVVTTANPHGIPAAGTGFAILSGVVGATGANNTVAGVPAWVATYVSPTTFSINNTAAPGAYSSGGVAEVGDLGMCDAAIQSQCVPTGQTALVMAASTEVINITASVYISKTAGISSATATTNIENAMANYFSSIPIGGVNAESAGIVPWSEVLTVIASVNTGTVSVVLGTPSGDTTLTAGQVPILGTTNITVVYV